VTALGITPVVTTASVSLRIAQGNRASLEQTAADRMEHDRRQAALDRTYDVRAETFLKALTWLSELDALADTSNFGDLGAIWKNDDWEKPFNLGATETLATEVGIYGGRDAEQLFREANTYLLAAKPSSGVTGRW